MSINYLSKAINIVGSQVLLASAIGIKQGHVWAWLNKTKKGIPGEYVIDVALQTNWQVTPHELRPDLYPHPEDGLPDHLRQVA